MEEAWSKGNELLLLADDDDDELALQGLLTLVGTITAPTHLT